VASAELRFAVVAVLFEHLSQLRVIRAFFQEKVDEACAGDLDFRDRIVGRHGSQQGRGELARILARRFRELHRDIAGEVAVL